MVSIFIIKCAIQIYIIKYLLFIKFTILYIDIVYYLLQTYTHTNLHTIILIYS